MKKFTLFLAFVVAFTTTAFGQIDTGKQYRLKSVSVGDYLTIAETNANTHGHVCGMPLDDNNQDQVFSFIDATNGQYYLKSATGKYFTDRGTGAGWNVNYSMNADEALAMTFEQIGENTYKIKCYNASKYAELYFKYEHVSASGLYHPFNDSNDGAEWVLEEASTIPQEMLAEARNAFNAAYETAIATIEAANLVIEKGEDLPLQTTDANSAYYTWSNAPEPTEGPIDQLVDGIAEHGNFFHTQWSKPVPAAPHYIEVDLGENNDLEKFVISYTTRINDNGDIADFPDAIEILGSNDKNEYTPIATFNDKLPQSEGQKWESTIAVNNGFRYLRLNVTAEKTFWHMAEFDITKMITNINESYRNVIVEIAALKTICENVANNADYGYYQLLDATATLNAAVEAVKAGVAEPEPETPFEVVAVTPTEAVAELTTVTVEFSEEIEGTFDMMGMKQIYLGTKSNGCSFEVNGKVLTITPFNAINTPGEYKLVIPEGLITRKSNGEAVTMNGEYVFTVEEPVVEPETPSALNETVVFDFASQNWGIATIEQNNYSNIKTAGEYTDGKYTINIDPTANGGSYIYDSKGFLNISKPGSKIVLPAFDFAVEKIEVVGHASATSYSKVDMNVFVGGTAVSTACIGSTETYTYEIAADNQAAGNVYELVIGSNGGNYSSVMYITYIKVYPAENKLEAPAIDLASGVYIGEQTVNVHSATANLEGVTNVTYYYTTDGNEPSVEDEDTDGEITITESCTLKVIVELTYGDKTYVSASTSAEYIISEAVTYHRATDVESGNYFLAANGHVAAPLANNVLPAVETTIDGNDLTEAAYYAITLEEAAEAGTYYIKDVNGNYIYTSSMYGTSGPKLSSNGAYIPMSSWTITIADDENSTATIVSEGLTLVYDTAAGVFKVTDSVSSDMILPTFYGTHETGIDGIYGDKLNGMNVNEGIYDLQGRKIETVTKGGIYIVNGKKVLVK